MSPSTLIKMYQRSRRSTESVILKNITPNHKVKQWNKILDSSANKTALIRFLFSNWRNENFVNLLGDKFLYITSEQKCIRISRNGVENVEQLSCTQEEADTRSIFHAKHASEDGTQAIIIINPNTDAVLLCL